MAEELPPNRMTSRDIKAQERRQQILVVAKRMFAAGGYHATSMRSLNKELGVAEALTYHYFPGGKLEILQTILREGRDARIAEIKTIVSQLKDDLPLRDALLLTARVGISLYAGDKELIQIGMRERNWLRHEEWVRTFPIQESPVAPLREYFARRMAQGEIRTMDLTFAVSQFFSGILMHSFFGDEEGDAAANDELYLNKLVEFTANLWST
ncbi:MAG: TetR/AcrR family transcriptional regulator [Anaerolineae bacterium]|nr:TetR/AcrR family transcriptional regulator [Anaerolineae bacterium]